MLRDRKRRRKKTSKDSEWKEQDEILLCTFEINH